MYFLPQHPQGGTAGGSSSHTGPSLKMNAHTDVCAHPAAGSSLAQRSPLGLRAPTPCCLPACSHLCTTMSGIFLSAQLGGEVVCGAMSTACTWASARGELPSSPHTSPPTHPPAIGMGGKGCAQAAQIPGRGQHWGARQDTHPTKPRHQQPRPCHSRWATGLSTPLQSSLGPAKVLVSVPQDMDGHPQHPQTYRHMHICHTCAHTWDTQDMAGSQHQSWEPRTQES